MGRIKDKIQYPIKGSPDNNDYVVGTDSKAGGATVSFRLGDLFVQTGGEGLLPKGGFDGTAQDIIDLIPTTTSELTNNGSFGGQPYVEQDSLDILQAQVVAIQAIVFGEGVDLTSIEELVIAIQDIQLYLDTILVNDLVTGGTTKALTAQQGVVLNGLITAINSELANKVDKVVGERLINAEEIQKLADQSGVNTGDQDMSSYQTLDEKGQVGGYAPLNNSVKIASEYLSIVNNLTAGGATSLLSAEQGRQIKLLIDDINTLLESDNIGLETIQGLGDAILQIQNDLSLLVVNNLIDGGATKALSAEQGVALKLLITQLAQDVTLALSFKEAAFIKKTAFNKDFGTQAGTVAEGSHVSDTNNPHGVTKGQVGLGNVDNTSDLEKPISTAAQTEFDLKLDKSSVVDPDVITKVGLVSQNGSLITIAALAFEWRIAQVDYTNTLEFTTTIANATDNFSRIDLIVANTSGSFTKIEGVEDVELAVKPNVPEGTLEVSFINVYGSTVSTAQPVTTGGEAFVAKKEFEFRKVNGGGNKASVNITDESASFRFPTADSISSISVNNNSLKYIYSGKKHYIKSDRATGDFTIFHNAGTGNYKYFFPSGEDLVIQSGEIVEFMFRLGTNNTGFLDYIGVAGIGGALDNKVDKVAGERLINAGEIQKLIDTSGTNTGDQDLSGKVDKVTGERLINAGEITKLSNTSGTNTGDQDLSGKVDKVTGERLINAGEITKLSNTSGTNTGDQDLSGKVDKVTGERLINAGEITKLSNTSGTNTGDQDLSGKQDVLVSGTNIKTLNGGSLLGAGDIVIVGGNSTSVGTRYETTWTSGSQQFTTPTDYFNVLSVFVNGISLKSTQYSLQGSNKVTILNTLNANDYVVIIYGSTVALVAEPTQITITTAVSITTDTFGILGKSQKGKHVLIDNGANAINITVNGGPDFTASYEKLGTGTITFVAGANRTLNGVDGTLVMNGAIGSTAALSCGIPSATTKDNIRISNAI
jgi:hypothetical protein